MKSDSNSLEFASILFPREAGGEDTNIFIVLSVRYLMIDGPPILFIVML